MFDCLWIEKYRPSQLDDLVVSSENKRLVGKFKTDGEIPNLCFAGPPGVGKTTLAKILVNNILECQYLYINASDENGIETIRSKVTNFAQIKSIDGCIKVIVLDECDGLSQDAQRALRNTMEECASVTRFVLTANHNHRIIPALQSRCQSLDLVPPLDLCLDRILYILKDQDITVADDQSELLKRFVKNNYPDLRKCINELQKACSSNKLQIVDTSKCNEFTKQVFSLTVRGHVLKTRQFIIENEDKFNGDYPLLLKLLFNHVHDTKISDENCKKMYLITLAEALYRSAFVMDQEINCYSCLVQISNTK